jgi:hypothetical protein
MKLSIVVMTALAALAAAQFGKGKGKFGGKMGGKGMGGFKGKMGGGMGGKGFGKGGGGFGAPPPSDPAPDAVAEDSTTSPVIASER